MSVNLGTFAAGTTSPSITVTFERPTSGTIDLTGCTVSAKVSRPNFSTLTKSLQVTNATGGQAILAWSNGDLACYGDDATYFIDFAITFANGEIEVQPQPATMIVRASVA